MNNWGPHWGEGGCGYLPYRYFLDYQDDAWLSMPYDKFPPRDGNMTHVQRLEIFPNPLGNACLVTDLFDIVKRRRLGWLFATVRGEGYLNVEDFYIEKGSSNPENIERLSATAFEAASDNELRIRYWIPHGDLVETTNNFLMSKAFIALLGLNVRPSPHRWASALAIT